MDNSDRGYPCANGLSLDQNLSMGPLGGPQSPIDLKPDASTLDQFSPQGGGGGGPDSPNSYVLKQVGLLCTSPGIGGSGGGGGGSKSGGQAGGGGPLPHPLSGSKHLCSICGDRASGKHYGVYSCEGCKGFFKRTVRKDLSYACREEKNCIIDKRQRNRCQYCRYQKCLTMGMKRNAVQEERQRTKDKDTSEVESTSNTPLEMSIDRILDAENHIDIGPFDNINGQRQLCDAHIKRLLYWAASLPHFTKLNIQDQVMLLKCSWNELHIITLAYRASGAGEDAIIVAPFMDRSANLEDAVDIEVIQKWIQDLVIKLREINLDPTEFACLRAIILFNSELRGLMCKDQVSTVREALYEKMEDHVGSKDSPEPGRFAKLLLRLPVLRSIALKCKTTLIFYSKLGDKRALETFLSNTLQNIQNNGTCTPKLGRI